MQTKLKSLVHTVAGTLAAAMHSLDEATRAPRHVVRRRAQSMVEYAIIAALVAVVALGAVKLLGSTVGTVFDNVTHCVDSTNKSSGTTCP